MCRKKEITRKFGFCDKYEYELSQNLIQIQSKVKGIDNENNDDLHSKGNAPPSGDYYTIDDPLLNEIVEFSIAITQRFNFNCLFLQTFSLLEFYVVKICRHYDRVNNLNYFNNKHSYYIKNCKEFITNELSYNIGKSKEWEQILLYQDLRNLFMHSLGNVQRKRHKKLLNKIRNEINIIVLDNGSRLFIKDSDFLRSVIRTSFLFYQELCNCIRKTTGEKRNLPDFTLFG